MMKWFPESCLSCGSAIAVIILLNNVWLSSCHNLHELFTPENAELLQIMKEELDLFQVDMTKSFMEEHSRRKRGLVSDISINKDGRFLETAVQPVGPFSTFTFEGSPYLIQPTGIFRIDGLAALESNTLLSDSNILTKVGSWSLQGSESVIDGGEWKRNFFLLTTNKQFSTIYTLHSSSLQPIFRQRIQNKGTVVAAQFFEYRRNFYLAMCYDNEQHSTTFSPIYRWAGSYMDETHQIQTTGASAVKTFTINSKKYIAIAQSKDSTGNMLLGTLILSMDHMERLERVQLLWSHGANSLHFMSTEKEHFLLIGQEKEPSIAYWFGGMDFIYWQQFEGLQGQTLVMDGLQLSEDEPMVVASDGGPLRFFSRSASATTILTSWVESKTLNVAPLTAAETVSHTKFLKVSGNVVYLAVTRKLPNSELEGLRLYPVNFVQRELVVSNPRPGDKLTQCLDELSSSLKNAQPILSRIEEEGPKVLTTDGDWTFNGVLASERVIKSDPTKVKVTKADITPEIQRRGSSDRIRMAPSKLLAQIEDKTLEMDKFQSDLDHVFFKSNPRSVSGSLTFAHPVKFNKFQGQNSDLQVESLNGVDWNDMKSSTLKLASVTPQQVTASWTMESLVADNIEVEQADSKLNPSNFMSKSCNQNSQRVTGTQQFDKMVKISQNVQLNPTTSVNNIRFADIAFKNSHSEIKGFKHAAFVGGDIAPERVNDVDLTSWFDSVAKINSLEPQQFTGPVIVGKDAAVHFADLNLQELNSQAWAEFERTVLLDGVDQTINGPVSFEDLRTDHLITNSISGVSFQDLLTSTSTQHISSELFVKTVKVGGALATSQINGAHLSDAVDRFDSQAVINGPVVLEGFTVQNVMVPEGITIAGKDVSELEKLRKVHVYSTVDGSPVVFQGLVETDNAAATSINDLLVSDFEKKYWSKLGDNVGTARQLVLSDRDVSVKSDGFESGHVNAFLFPQHFVSLDKARLVLNAPLRFDKSVTVLGNVTMEEGKTVEGIDMSKIQSIIVDSDFQRVVTGKKTFGQPIVVSHGAQFDILNGLDPTQDVVLLSSGVEQIVEGQVIFKEEVIADTVHIQNDDLSVRGLVNGLNLEELKATTACTDKANSIEGAIVFENSVKASELSTGALNAFNVHDITENMIFLSASDAQEMTGGIVVTNGGATFLSDSIARQINGVPVIQYLSQVQRIDSKPAEALKGTKTFLNAVILGEVQCLSLNNMDLQDLERNALSKSKSQVISGQWSLENVHFKENLDATEIGGVPLSNVVFTDEDAEVESPVHFTSTRTTIRGPLTVEGTVNGITFNEAMKDFVHIEGAQRFSQLAIQRNLAWAQDLPDIQRLSYLFANGVSTKGPQMITGPVQFSQGFSSAQVLSPNEWLSRIDLGTLNEDALMKNDLSWDIAGENQFSKGLTVASFGQPVSTLDVSDVNGINLKEMSDDIVKRNDESGRLVQGTKGVDGTVTANEFNILKTISDFPVQDFVIKDDKREISQLQLDKIIINKDMDVESISGFDLQKLLENRVSLSKPQDLSGDFTFDDVDATQSCDVTEVNDVVVSHAMQRDGRGLTRIVGNKVFEKGLSVEGELSTPSLNKHSIQELVHTPLRLDRKEVIEREVIFEAPVVVNQEVEMETLNDVNVHILSKDVSGRIGRLIKEAKTPELLSNAVSSKLQSLQRLTEEQPVWMQYLRMKQDWTSLGPQSKVDHIKRSKTGDVLVTLHNPTDGEAAGLPSGCKCNTVHTVMINDLKADSSKTESVGVDNCLQVFHVTNLQGKGYTVTSETPSSNVTCISGADKPTKIFSEDQSLGEISMGHVSDVGVFTDRGHDYLVLAEYFDKESRSHATSARVIRVESDGSLKSIQAISTHGTKKVALDQISGRWMLAIANTANIGEEVEAGCSTDSAIYAWSPMDDEFVLLRTVATDGAFDAQFVKAQALTNEFFDESFVAFAQEGNSAVNDVMIYRYDQLEGNFAFAQSIHSKSPVTALKSTNLCRQNFLVTVSPQEGITFFKNRFVEGFQEYYKAPVYGATDFSTFNMNGQELFAIATTKGPFLTEAVMAGSCPN